MINHKKRQFSSLKSFSKDCYRGILFHDRDANRKILSFLDKKDGALTMRLNKRLNNDLYSKTFVFDSFSSINTIKAFINHAYGIESLVINNFNDIFQYLHIKLPKLKNISIKDDEIIDFNSILMEYKSTLKNIELYTSRNCIFYIDDYKNLEKLIVSPLIKVSKNGILLNRKICHCDITCEDNNTIQLN